MTIDFNAQEFQSFPHFKGGEKDMLAKMFFDGTCRIIRGCLPPGASIGYHQHVDNCEIIFILSGEGTAREDDAEVKVVAGQATYCEKGHFHSLANTGTEPLEIFCVVPEVR